MLREVTVIKFHHVFRERRSLMKWKRTMHPYVMRENLYKIIQKKMFRFALGLIKILSGAFTGAEESTNAAFISMLKIAS